MRYAADLHAGMCVMPTPIWPGDVKLPSASAGVAEYLLEPAEKFRPRPSLRDFEHGMKVQFVPAGAALAKLARRHSIEAEHATCFDSLVMASAVEEAFHAARLRKSFNLHPIVDQAVYENSIATEVGEQPRDNEHLLHSVGLASPVETGEGFKRYRARYVAKDGVECIVTDGHEGEAVGY